MKPYLIGLAALVVGGGVAGAALAGGSDEPPHPPTGAQTAQVRVPWIVLETGRDSRSLVIQYRAAFCHRAPGEATVRETNEAIAIRVHEQVSASVGGRRRSCKLDLLTPRLVVRLAHPVAGRSIEGAGYGYPLDPGSVSYLSHGVPDTPNPTVRLPLVPRVIGLSRFDATTVLTAQGFHVQVRGAGNGEVITQDPAPGHLAPGSNHAAPYDGVVSITTA